MSFSQLSPDPVRRNSLSNVKITSQLRKKSVTRMVSVSSDSNLAASSVLFDDIKIDDDDADVFQSPQEIAQQQGVNECLKWIADKQILVESLDFGESRPEIELALNEQRRKSKEIDVYSSVVDKVKANVKDQRLKDKLDQSYFNLKETAQRRLECLENNLKIVGLDRIFGPLSSSFHNIAASLVHVSKTTAKSESSTNTGYNAQQCILASCRAWDYVSRQLKCAEVQLRHASEYYQFFFDIKQYQQWMTADLRKINDVVTRVNLFKNGRREDPRILLPEIKMAFSTYLNWRSRIDLIYERSCKVLPVHLRSSPVGYERPVTSLDSYQTKELNVSQGEELIVMDNSKQETWKVHNLRGDTNQVPSVQLVLNGPDLTAIDEAMKLRFQFFSTWSNSVRRLGKALINFISGSLKDWSGDEENKLRSLNQKDKQQLRSMLTTTTHVFSPYWDVFLPYQNLLNKTDRLEKLVNSASSRDNTGVSVPLLVGQAEPVQEMIETYKEFWDHWEQFRCLSDAKHCPENLLGRSDWDRYKFLDSVDCLAKWQLELGENDDDLIDGSTKMYEIIVEDEIYTIETEKETAETSQISTSEQEEKQTFVITSVIDPRNGQGISLKQAVSLGIINQQGGRYINPQTRESIPISAAMNSGKIQVELTTTNKSTEKKSDMGLITIKTRSESRPFSIRGVVDATTERQLSVDDAIRAGILDQKRGVYKNSLTKREMSITDALDNNLLIVEFEHYDELQNGNGEQSDIVTYAIHGVMDPVTSQRMSFSEAVHSGLMDAESGSYYNKYTRETIYVGDAIKRGLLKASVVHDPRVFNITSGSLISLSDPDQLPPRQLQAPLQPRQLQAPLQPTQAPPPVSRVQNGFNGHFKETNDNRIK